MSIGKLFHPLQNLLKARAAIKQGAEQGITILHKMSGFIDAHGHFVEYGNTLFSALLYGSTSFEEVLQRVKQFADAHPGLAWIEGRGWDQNKFPGKAFPDNTLLDQLFPATPVVLERVDGHALIANTKALELAGIHAGQTLEGGTVETKNGKLTGILIDNAQRLLRHAM